MIDLKCASTTVDKTNEINKMDNTDIRSAYSFASAERTTRNTYPKIMIDYQTK
jgi:hypothetical protein